MSQIIKNIKPVKNSDTAKIHYNATEQYMSKYFISDSSIENLSLGDDLIIHYGNNDYVAVDPGTQIEQSKKLYFCKYNAYDTSMKEIVIYNNHDDNYKIIRRFESRSEEYFTFYFSLLTGNYTYYIDSETLKIYNIGQRFLSESVSSTFDGNDALPIILSNNPLLSKDIYVNAGYDYSLEKATNVEGIPIDVTLTGDPTSRPFASHDNIYIS